jgi:hypothetical protein
MLPFRPFGTWLCCGLITALGWALQVGHAQMPQEYLSRQPAPAVRIVAPVDEGKLTRLRGILRLGQQRRTIVAQSHLAALWDGC